MPTMTGVPMADYIRMAAISASLLRAVVERCPRAAWWDSWLNPHRVADFTDASDAGTIAHEILLEGSESGVAVIDPEDYPAERTGAIPTGWTTKAIREARDYARATGKIPVLKDDMAEIRSMVASARLFVDSLRTTEPAVWRAFQPDGGESELTMCWNEADAPCKLRADRISTDRGVIVDAKFTATSAHPDVWGRTQMSRMGYHQSAALYRRGVQAVCGVAPDYLFLVVESEPPYLCSLVGVDPAWLAVADERNKSALRIWQQCARDGHWPGYPNRAAYPELPAWMTAQMEASDPSTDEHGITYDVSKIWSKSP